MNNIINFKIHADDKGKLISVENNTDIPFDIKRIFYIYDTDNDSIRGNHANIKSEFIMICLRGSCKIKLFDQLGNESTYTLDSPHIGLYIPKMMWKEMYDFQDNAILLVLSNEKYSSNEYIRDYNQFIKIYK